MSIRTDWSRAEIAAIYHTPLLTLVSKANSVHQQSQTAGEVQVCTLLSIKTGGCPEDCGYCSQSVHNDSTVESHALLPVEDVLCAARKAKENGSSRFCMGAAWRNVRNNEDFKHVLEMVSRVREMGLEVCTTLGMVDADQAKELADAGLTAYNHNLDTSRSHYESVVTTRSYDDRLRTLRYVADAGISMCTGGIIGLGETHDDRIDLLHTLASLPKHPESMPVNALVPIPGTPLENNTRVTLWDMLRMIATARIVMPGTVVRLSAGRELLSESDQALCFLAGANSIFSGEKLLTAPNAGPEADKALFEILGINPRQAFKQPCGHDHDHYLVHEETPI